MQLKGYEFEISPGSGIRLGGKYTVGDEPRNPREMTEMCDKYRYIIGTALEDSRPGGTIRVRIRL